MHGQQKALRRMQSRGTLQLCRTLQVDDTVQLRTLAFKAAMDADFPRGVHSCLDKLQSTMEETEELHGKFSLINELSPKESGKQSGLLKMRMIFMHLLRGTFIVETL